jgi:preprotein translocase subunit YajC
MIDILAQDAPTGGGGALSFLIFLVPIGLLFFMMRNQRKRMAEQQQLQQGVDVGDEVLTSSGMFGTVVDVDEDDDTIWVEIAPGTRVHMVRGGVARRIVDEDETVDEDEEQDADQP